MYLKELTLHNFKCYEDFTIQFNKQLTVIVGINGAGKSTILEAAATALSAMFTPLDGVKSRGINKTDARLATYSMGSLKDVQHQYPVVISAKADMDGEEISWSRSLNTAKSGTTIKDAKELIDVAECYQNKMRQGDTSLILPLFAYYGTRRLWDYHREKQTDVFGSNMRTNGYIDSLDGTTNIKLMMNWFAKMTVQKYQNQEIGMGGIPELEGVLAAMEKCFSLISGINKVKILYSLNAEEIEVVYQNEMGQIMRIPLNQLSDGYKSTISLVADIAYRMSVLNPQLMGEASKKTGGVILIDEVDLHLHPSWQQRVLDDLTAIFPNVQFIVTTHAPAVINTVRSENLALLENHEVDYPQGEIYGKDVNTILIGTMKTEERPKAIKSLFSDFYDSLYENDFDKCETVLHQIEDIVSNNDADLSACKLKLRLRKQRRNLK